MYPLGILFGLTFDSATEIGLLGISAAEPSKGLPIWSIMVFPAYRLVECMFVGYANRLRAEYPGRKIRNATVFASAIPAFARFGYIELVRKTSIPKHIPEFLIKTIKRSKEDALWIPSKNFPRNPMDLYEEMKPSMHGDAVVWRHRPSKSRKIGPLFVGRLNYDWHGKAVF